MNGHSSTLRRIPVVGGVYNVADRFVGLLDQDQGADLYWLPMDPQHLRDYAGRAWHLVAAHKRAYWTRALRQQSDLATFEASQALWTHMRQVRPEWPSAKDRAEDLAHHVTLRRALDRAASVTARSAGR